MRFRFPTAIRLFWGGVLLVCSQSAFAGPAFYVDAGGGYLQMRNPSSFSNGSLSGTASGYGLGLGLWTTFTTREHPIEFQLGVQDRYDSSSNQGISEGLNIPYAVARLQITRIFLAAGYSPYVMRSVGGSSASSTVLSHAVGAHAFLGEAGTLFPVTPKFSFGLSAVYETVQQNGVSSPSPVISGNVFMRFYFGFGSGDSSGSDEWHGWRYPFGHEME